MIPKQAIEKAIEGGWLKTPYTRQLERSARDEGWTFRYFIPTKKGDTTFPSDSYMADYEIICTPSFWQALFKEYKSGLSFNIHRRHLPQWHEQALQFYDLILTGGDTEKFWEEILAN